MATRSLKSVANPLLDPSPLPHEAPPFGDIKPKHIVPAYKASGAKLIKVLDEIASNLETPTVANTVTALEEAQNQYDMVDMLTTILSDSDYSYRLGVEINRTTRPAARINSKLYENEKLFRRIKYLYDHRDELQDSQERVLVEKMYERFRGEGAHLSENDRRRYRQLSTKLSNLCSEYSLNLDASARSKQVVVDTAKELEGLPRDYIKLCKEAAIKAGKPRKWVIPMVPFTSTVLEYARNRSLRERFYESFKQVGDTARNNNQQLVLKIIRTRDQMARIMGYGSYAEYALDSTMAKSATRVREMIDTVKKEALAKQIELHAHIRKLALERDNITEFQEYDFFYYGRLLKEQVLDIDEAALREYFPLDHVLSEMHRIVEEEFGLRFVLTENKYTTIHPDVKTYEVIDKDTGKLLGIRYVDLYARPGHKSDGGWTHGLRQRSHVNGKTMIPISVEFNNFSKPARGEPVLSNMEYIRGLWHELGHSLHNILPRTKHSMIYALGMEKDFTEVPSTIFENWALRDDVLKRIGRHYKTGKTIPDDKIAKIQQSHTWERIMSQMKYLTYSFLDMSLHGTAAGSIKDLHEVEATAHRELGLMPRENGTLISTDLAHLFDAPEGYAAHYYSYTWAEIIAANINHRYNEERAKSPEDGKAFARRIRQEMFEVGAGKKAEEIFFNIMQEAPDFSICIRQDRLNPELFMPHTRSVPPSPPSQLKPTAPTPP